MFQKDRLLRAGATEEEAKQLESEYDLSPAEAQRSQDERLAGISESDIRIWLEGLRELRYFDPEGDGVETEPAAESEGEQSESESEVPQETPEEAAAREQLEKEAAEAEAAAAAAEARGGRSR